MYFQLFVEYIISRTYIVYLPFIKEHFKIKLDFKFMIYI